MNHSYRQAAIPTPFLSLESGAAIFVLVVLCIVLCYLGVHLLLCVVLRNVSSIRSLITPPLVFLVHVFFVFGRWNFHKLLVGADGALAGVSAKNMALYINHTCRLLCRFVQNRRGRPGFETTTKRREPVAVFWVYLHSQHQTRNKRRRMRSTHMCMS